MISLSFFKIVTKKGIDIDDKILSLVELFEDKFPRVARPPYPGANH